KMNEKAIKIKYRLERSDYNSLRTYYMYRRKTSRTKFMVCILAASLILMVINETVLSFLLFKLIGLVGFFIIAVMYSWISIDARRLEKAVKDTVSSTLELNLDGSGLSAHWSDLNLRKEFSWSEMNYAYESDSHFYLFTDQYFAIIIPRLLLKDFQVRDIHSLLENHIHLISDLSGYQYQNN
ncbi:MAG: YcxB family protein, partial [Bacillota bacterium]